MRMRLMTGALATLFSAACAATVMRATMSPLDVQMASEALEPGTSSIRGSALIRQRGGGVVTCAGQEVFLIPGTESASRELLRIFGSDQGYVPRGGDEILGGGTLVLAPEPNRRTFCDAQGFFTFDDLQTTKWHIMTAVLWTIGGDYQGGTLLATTEVADGQEVEVVLSY